MDVVYPVCCGIDVHQARLTACLRRVQEDGQVTKDVQEFDTTYPALLVLLDWLIAQHCPVVAMESTGVYWKPVYHVLANAWQSLTERHFTLTLIRGNREDHPLPNLP